MSLLRLLVFALIAIVLAPAARAGITPYTDPGKIDFDQALELLKPDGTWVKVEGKWAFTPNDHAAPYTNGRWLYSEFGWLWRGNASHSWATEHYGYWKRGTDEVWAWYPGPVWLPQTVELRGSSAGIGWRSAEVDSEGNFVESPADRFTRISEWTFVKPVDFAGPITPAVIAQGAASEEMLEQSIVSVHSYLTYREIDRPGPHPADFVNLGDGRMFAPMTAEEKARALHPAAQATTKPAAAATNAAPVDTAKLAASLNAAETMPEIPQQPGGEDPNDDPRQVKYWVSRCLPKAETPIPADAARDQLFLYRPDFYQDEDGIERRIAFWLDPKLRSSEQLHLADVLKNHRAPAVTTNGSPTAPAVPAVAAKDFDSPFAETFRPAATTRNESTKAPAPAGTNAPPVAVPDGRAR